MRRFLTLGLVEHVKRLEMAWGVKKKQVWGKFGLCMIRLMYVCGELKMNEKMYGIFH